MLAPEACPGLVARVEGTDRPGARHTGRAHPARSSTGRNRPVAMTPVGSVDTDVLVVGAGPTGLMLANQLARRGVRALIIDRHAGPSRETRALGVQARTLEI